MLRRSFLHILSVCISHSYQEFLSVMDPLQSVSVLPSNGPALPHGTESPKGNLGLSSLESTPTATRSTSRALHRTSLPCSNARSQTIGGAIQIQERKRRKRNEAFPRDPLFTKAELQSEKYLNYRKKNKQGGKKSQEEQIWNDELEEVFQLGMIRSM